MKKNTNAVSRRKFLQSSGKIAAGTLVMSQFPTIVPSSVFGKNAPSNRINVGAIGCGRIAVQHDIASTARFNSARIIAVCDLDRNRADAAPAAVKSSYTKAAKENGGLTGDWDMKVYYDYKELLQNKDIDAVLVSLPDHHHAIVSTHAVNAGKHVYLQKPASLTIEEGRMLSNAVKKSGKILQLGSQQRSADPWPQFQKDYDWYLSLPELVLPTYFDAAHCYSLFFQIDRAFSHIFQFIIGSSMPTAKLRAAIWESIFTHDMRRYVRGVHRSMGDITTLITGKS